MTQRQGQIVRRGDSKFLVRWYVGRIEGKRVYGSEIVEGTYRQAEAALTRKLGEKDSGSLTHTTTKLTLGAYLDEYLGTVAPALIAESTLLHYKSTVRLYLPAMLRAMPLQRVSMTSVQRAVNELHEQGYSRSIMVSLRAVLSVAFTHAIRTRMLRDNPCHYVSLPKTKARESSILTAAEARKLLDTAQEGSEWSYAFWCISLLCGLRPSETRALLWSDIEGDLLHVQRALSKTATGSKVADPKTERGFRKITLPARVVDALQAHRRAQAAAMLEAGPSYARLGLIFGHEKTGLHQRLNTIAYRWKGALADAGLPANVRLYDARHTSISILLAEGLSPKAVADRHGHDVMTMMKTYAHTVPGVDRQIAETMERVING